MDNKIRLQILYGERALLFVTRIMAHPEGMKARMAANKSDTVSAHTTNNTVMTDKKPRKRSALRIRNMS